jgi:hypothetical protein
MEAIDLKGSLEEMECEWEHQEVPEEDAVVKPVKGWKKRHRGWNLAAGRHGEPKELTQEDCRSGRKLAAACRKVSFHARVHGEKGTSSGKLWTAQGVDHSQNKDNPLCKSGMKQGTPASEARKRGHCTENPERKNRGE